VGAVVRAGAYELALKDYEQAVQLDPGAPEALFRLGIVRFFVAQYPQAAGDIDRALSMSGDDTLMLSNGGAADSDLKYHPIWRYLAHPRAGGDARPGLRSAAARIGVRGWPFPVIQFLDGDIDEAALLSAAAGSDPATQRAQTCEASAYLGEDRLMQHDRTAAAQWFRRARQLCAPAFTERALAGAELQRLGG
jgi:lipoprotein NlpI